MERYLISKESNERTSSGKVGVHGAGHEEEADAGHQPGTGQGEARNAGADSTSPGNEGVDSVHLAGVSDIDIDSGEAGSLHYAGLCVEDAGHKEVGMVHTAEHQDGAVRQSQIEQIPWPHDNLDDAFVLVTENDSGLVKNARGLDAGLTLIGERWDDEPNGVLNVELGETEAGQSGCVDRTEGHNSGECMGGGSLGGRQVVPEAIAGCNDALDIKSGGDRAEGQDDGEYEGDVNLGIARLYQMLEQVAMLLLITRVEEVLIWLVMI